MNNLTHYCRPKLHCQKLYQYKDSSPKNLAGLSRKREVHFRTRMFKRRRRGNKDLKENFMYRYGMVTIMERRILVCVEKFYKTKRDVTYVMPTITNRKFQETLVDASEVYLLL